MAAIGSVVIDIIAKTLGFETGVKKVSKGIKGMHGNIASIASMMKTAFVAAGAYLSVKAISGFVGSTLDAADSTVKLSNALGMSATAFYGLQQAAKFGAVGMDPEAFATSMQKFAKSLGEATMKGGPAEGALQQLGLTAEQLTNQRLDESFLQVADAVSQIQNPMQRATILTNLFGKQGQKLAPMFEQGAEGVKAAIQAASNGLSDTDFGRMAAARRSIEELEKAWDNIKMLLTSALAPILQTIADKLKDLMPQGDTLKNVFVNALHGIAKGIAYVLDGWRFFKIGVLSVVAIGASAFAGLVKVVQVAVESIITALNYIPGVDIEMPQGLKNFATQTTAFADDMWRQVKELYTQPLAMNQVDKFFEDVNKKSVDSANKIVQNNPIKAISDECLKSRGDIAKWFEDINREIDQFGMTALEKKLDDFKRLAGVTANDIAQAEESIKMLQTLEDMQKKVKTERPTITVERRFDFRLPEAYRQASNDTVSELRRIKSEAQKQTQKLTQIATNTTPSNDDGESF